MEVAMPPKVKVTKKEIIDTALLLCRQSGESAINARGVADALGCSTQPIFSNFATMEDLHAAVMAAAYEEYFEFIENEVRSGKYPRYKAFGMAYIRFAKEEKQLFRLLFMCDRDEGELTPTADFEASVELIMEANGISRERARLMHLEMWACVHGIGTMLATSFLTLEWDLISDMITDVYRGLCERHLPEEA
jgi:AcrR family transcriptional regulator